MIPLFPKRMFEIIILLPEQSENSPMLRQLKRIRMECFPTLVDELENEAGQRNFVAFLNTGALQPVDDTLFTDQALEIL